jgi:type IV secretion system protein TrbE
MSKSYPDLLPWGHLATPGTVFTKRSQLLTGYWFRPPDADSQPEEDADTLSDHVNAALASFGTRWATWSDVISYRSGHYPSPEQSHFPDPFSRAVDDERRRHFEGGQHFENDRAFLFCYTPPPRQVARLTDLLFSGEAIRPPTITREMEFFAEELDRFENRIAGTIGLVRMNSFTVTEPDGRQSRQDELVNYLNYCATGRVQNVMLPKAGALLDRLIASQEVTPGERPVIGHDYVAVVTIDGIPAESHPNIIAALNTLAIPYRFSQRMIYLDPVHARSEIKKYRDQWGQKVHGFLQRVLQSHGKGENGIIDQHAAKMAKQAEDAYAETESGHVVYGYYSPAVVIRHQDPVILKDWADRIEREIAHCGFGALTETTNTIEAWRAALPGDVHSNVRRPIIHTKTASDLLPLSSVWTGEEMCPSPQYPPGSPALLWADTAGSIPFRLNLFIGPRSEEGHTLVFGPTDAGKSTLLNTVAVQALRYAGMRITCFDYKQGMMVTALACGGQFYDLANTEGVNGVYSPLAVLATETDIEWATDYLAQLYELQTEHPPGPELRPAIYEAVQSLSMAPPHLRTMSHFVFSALQDIDARQVFEFYTMKGPAGRYLDGVADPTDNSEFLVYETRELMGLGKQTALAVLLYLFRRFDRSLDGRPAILFLAEAWQVLQHPIWGSRLYKWLRELRSKNATVVMDTQSLADAVNTPMASLLNESCKRKIFLPNPAASQPGPRELYKQFGMNDRQVEIIANAVRRHDYYVTGPDGCRKVSLGLSDLELAVVGATSETEVAAVREAIRKHGDQWLSRYLADKGIAYGTRKKEVEYA